jgi:hypothetical protein
MDIAARYVKGDDETDSGLELEPYERKPYPHGNSIMKIWLVDEQRSIDVLADRLQSERLQMNNLKIDGFIAELLVRDMLSLGTDVLNLDLSLKWSPVCTPVSEDSLLHVGN